MSINKYRLSIIKSTIRAFTLLELIIVIAVIAVTSAILVPNVIGQRRMAKIQAANDGAYTVYVATQDYLNNLQKRGLDAKKYFGKSGKLGGGKFYEDSGIGFLSVNGGVLQPVDGSKRSRAYMTGDQSAKMADADRPEEAKLIEAFAGIAKRMGRDVIRPTDPEYTEKNAEGKSYYDYLDNAGVAGMPLSPQMNKAGESFLIEVYPDTYTVRCVYYTTYKTEREERVIDNSSNKAVFTGYGTDDIFLRIYGKHNDLKLDNGSVPDWNQIGSRGFDSTSKKGGANLSQEYASTIAGYTKMGNTYAPAYVGQYPIPGNGKRK